MAITQLQVNPWSPRSTMESRFTRQGQAKPRNPSLRRLGTLRQANVGGRRVPVTDRKLQVDVLLET